MAVKAVKTAPWPEIHYTISSDGARPAWTPTSVACVCVAGLVFAASLTGTYLLWFTSFYEEMIHSSMMYTEGSEFIQAWMSPPFGPTTKMYLYNYTNAEDFMAGRAARLAVRELGPYSYAESLEHVNVHFHANGTMSYSEKRTFTFLPEESVGTEEDVVLVPNLPLLCAIARVRDEPYVAQLGLRSALWASGTTAFNKLIVRDYLFGYNDTFYSIAKAAVEAATGGTLPKLGMLASRVGQSSNTYTVHTGHLDYTQQDVVTKLNGRPGLGAWRQHECNSIDGSAGTFFPVDLVRRRAPVHLVNADICRRIPLEFKKEVTVMDDIPALRYGPPDNFLDNGEDNPNNTCFSTASYARLPSGVFLNGPCFMDSPSFISFPRFYLGDPALRAAIDGIPAPVKEEHEMYFDIHPELGVNLGAATRFQINVMVRKTPMLDSYLEPFSDSTIMPILWFETALTEFPDDVKQGTYHATFTVRALERAAQVVLPLLAALCLVVLYRLCRPRRHRPGSPFGLAAENAGLVGSVNTDLETL
ncbi:hypothetical protein ONE63_008881 [Megalurothrips usitatus]|uniref:Scavenger receptor class B member 1-like n=1 Tax=Megalurothrips usitatus TaxID=439358 RepID=A0AAV7XKJ9_9NEOP|nr:hypothetical protein ONE63_008881 [Megalurothrips usitatus]